MSQSYFKYAESNATDAKQKENQMTNLPITLSIKGMTCDGCAAHAKEALEKIPGVKTAEVCYKNAKATITTSSPVEDTTLIKAIADAGYTVINQDESTLHVAIIGSGSAAFACAIKATEGGARVTIIEGAEVIGGCCVNVGCVPSKILIRAAELAENQRDNPFTGIENREPVIDRSKLTEQQVSRVDELRSAKYENILASNPSLTLLKGYASFQSASTLLVSMKDGTEQTLQADRILIATGSKPMIPPIEGLDDTPYWTSTEALFATQTPQHLVVIGSSVIAVEIAQAYRRLGAEVTLLARHTLLYSEDPLLGEALKHSFEKEGLHVLTHTQASHISYQDGSYQIETNAGLLECDQLLIATGRQANTDQLNLAAAGVETTSKNEVRVNTRMETNVANIYAAGDCSDMPQFVYVAAAAGSRAGANMTGGTMQLDLSAMPAVIFTDPQVATVGLTEAEATQKGIATKVRVLDLENVPRALANFETDGFIKLVAEAGSGRLLGAQILAHNAGEIIQSAALAIVNQMTVDNLANQLFPYLTMVEGLKLCAQTFNKDVTELSCCAG